MPAKKKAAKRKRNYRKEYDNYQGRPEQIERRSSRNKARRKMAAAGRAKKGDGKDVAHKDNNPKNNSRGNLKMASKKANRTEPRRRGRKKVTKRKTK